MFYSLVYSKTLSGNAGVTQDKLNIPQKFPIDIYAIGQTSTSINYLFNFEVAGQNMPFFGINDASVIGVNMVALFPTNILKPFQLSDTIRLTPSDILLISLTDKSGSTNTIQLVFFGRAIL